MDNKYRLLTLLALVLILAVPSLAEENDDEAGNLSIADHNEERNDEAGNLSILINGSLSPEGMERVGKPISVVDKKELRQSGATSIGDALATLPGVSSSSFGPGSSRPVIRGQSKERVRVIENGLENGDVSGVSDDHAVTSDSLTAERVDILRGPSTLLFGSQAIGGVVNIIDGSISEEPVGKDLTGSLNLNLGDSANDELSGAAVLEGQAGSINWHASVFAKDTGDIEIPGFAESSAVREAGEDEGRGTLENSDSESVGGKLGLSHAWDSGFFGVAVKRNESEYGIPGGHGGEEGEQEGEEEEEEGPVRIDLEQTRIEARGAVHLHNEFLDSVRYGFVYSDYEHKELEGPEVGTLFERDAFEGRVLFGHHHDDVFEGGVGLQVNFDELTAVGDEAFIPSSETLSPAVFFIEDFSLSEELVFQIGGRYEYTSVNPDTSSSEDFNSFSASTGLIHTTENREYSAAVNLSLSQRAPNTTELFADGAHIAAQTFEIGDASLDEETSLGAEIILSKLRGPFRGSLTAFVQEFDDYINLSPLGLEEDGFPVFIYSPTDARFWGFEAEAEYDIFASEGQILTAVAGFDLVRAKDTDADRSLPRITPVRTKLGLDYTLGSLDASVESLFVESQDRVAEFELPTNSYVQLNAGVSYDIPVSEEVGLEVFLRGTNLMNDEARVHTSFLKDQAPLRGRAFFVGGTATF